MVTNRKKIDIFRRR